MSQKSPFVKKNRIFFDQGNENMEPGCSKMQEKNYSQEIKNFLTNHSDFSNNTARINCSSLNNVNTVTRSDRHSMSCEELDFKNAEDSANGSCLSSWSPDPLHLQPRSPSYGTVSAEFQRSPSQNYRQESANFPWSISPSHRSHRSNSSQSSGYRGYRPDAVNFQWSRSPNYRSGSSQSSSCWSDTSDAVLDFRWSKSPNYRSDSSRSSRSQSYGDEEKTPISSRSHVSRRDQWEKRKRKRVDRYSPPQGPKKVRKSRSRSEKKQHSRADLKSSSKLADLEGPIAGRTRSRSKSVPIPQENKTSRKRGRSQAKTAKPDKSSDRSKRESIDKGNKENGKTRKEQRSRETKSNFDREPQPRSKSVNSKSKNKTTDKSGKQRESRSRKSHSIGKGKDEVLVRRSDRLKSTPKPAPEKAQSGFRSKTVKKGTSQSRRKRSRSSSIIFVDCIANRTRSRSKSVGVQKKNETSRKRGRPSSKAPKVGGHADERSDDERKFREKKDAEKLQKTEKKIGTGRKRGRPPSKAPKVRCHADEKSDDGRKFREKKDAEKLKKTEKKIETGRKRGRPPSKAPSVRCRPDERSDDRRKVGEEKKTQESRTGRKSREEKHTSPVRQEDDVPVKRSRRGKSNVKKTPQKVSSNEKTGRRNTRSRSRSIPLDNSVASRTRSRSRAKSVMRNLFGETREGEEKSKVTDGFKNNADAGKSKSKFPEEKSDSFFSYLGLERSEKNSSHQKKSVDKNILKINRRAVNSDHRKKNEKEIRGNLDAAGCSTSSSEAAEDLVDKIMEDPVISSECREYILKSDVFRSRVNLKKISVGLETEERLEKNGDDENSEIDVTLVDETNEPNSQAVGEPTVMVEPTVKDSEKEVVKSCGEVQDEEDDRDTVVFDSEMPEPILSSDSTIATDPRLSEEDAKRLLEEIAPTMKKFYNDFDLISCFQKAVKYSPRMADSLNSLIRDKQEKLTEDLEEYKSSILKCFDQLVKMYSESWDPIFQLMSKEFNIPRESIEMIINRCRSTDAHSREVPTSQGPSVDEFQGTASQTQEEPEHPGSSKGGFERTFQAQPTFIVNVNQNLNQTPQLTGLPQMTPQIPISFTELLTPKNSRTVQSHPFLSVRSHPTNRNPQRTSAIMGPSVQHNSHDSPCPTSSFTELSQNPLQLPDPSDFELPQPELNPESQKLRNRLKQMWDKLREMAKRQQLQHKAKQMNRPQPKNQFQLSLIQHMGVHMHLQTMQSLIKRLQELNPHLEEKLRTEHQELGKYVKQVDDQMLMLRRLLNEQQHQDQENQKPQQRVTSTDFSPRTDYTTPRRKIKTPHRLFSA